MAAKLFIDTWGWLTLHDKGERYHQQATQAYQQAIAQSGQIYTTDYVLDETFTFFGRHARIRYYNNPYRGCSLHPCGNGLSATSLNQYLRNGV